jgi:hypothetical protein
MSGLAIFGFKCPLLLQFEKIQSEAPMIRRNLRCFLKRLVVHYPGLSGKVFMIYGSFSLIAKAHPLLWSMLGIKVIDGLSGQARERRLAGVPAKSVKKLRITSS